MRIVFMGTPSFALPSLTRIVEAGFEVISIITRPDRPGGRGLNITPPEVKTLATRLGIPVFQPARIGAEESIAYIKGLSPEAIVVVAYGQILPPEILNIPESGCINLHASLLPRLRGAAPIQWAILLGNKTSGVTTIYMDEGMDTGDIILQREVEILDEDTSADLSERLSIVGADLLLETLRLIEMGRPPRFRQDEAIATYAPPITKKDAIIDWSRSAACLHNLIRGLNPIPGAYSYLEGKRIKFYRSRVVELSLADKEPGEILEGEGMVVVCGKGGLSILELQMEGKRALDIKAYLAGHRLREGMRFKSGQSG